jgi:hypothetical protein
MDRIELSVDLSRPRYDQSKFLGRYRHFRETASVFNAFASKGEIEDAERLIGQYR